MGIQVSARRRFLGEPPGEGEYAIANVELSHQSLLRKRYPLFHCRDERQRRFDLIEPATMRRPRSRGRCFDTVMTGRPSVGSGTI